MRKIEVIDDEMVVRFALMEEQRLEFVPQLSIFSAERVKTGGTVEQGP
jgi:hypothetical protein